MQETFSFYPVQITSRSVAKRRLRGLSWSALGVAFGVGCVLSAAPSLEWSSSLSSPAPAPLIEAQTPPPVLPAAVPQPVQLADASADVPAAPMPTPSAIYPLEVNLKVGKGDTLIEVLTDAGVSHEEASRVAQSLRKAFDAKKMHSGQTVTIALDKNPDEDLPYITGLKLPVSVTSHIEATRLPAGDADSLFKVRTVDAPTERHLAYSEGRIDSSLYETAMDAGIPLPLLQEMITAYSYDVDFQRDIKPGNKIEALYEKMKTKEGVTAGYGHLVFAQLQMGSRALKIYRYVDKAGNVDFYNEKGESLRKALLRTPINGAHITSGYGMRNHPLLGYTKMHRGVDFGAAAGTPIYAAGDGVVAFAGVQGGYGNYLKISHNAKYASAYGHVSRFAPGITPGKKVRQGQVVAYVGSTGMSTGPHLHYEILLNNQQVNPSGIKFKTGNVLAGKELAAFKRNAAQVQASIEANRKTTMAAADGGAKVAN